MSSGRVGQAFVLTCFFLRAVTAGTGNWGWVFAQPVTAGTGVNGLMLHYKNSGHRLSSSTIMSM